MTLLEFLRRLAGRRGRALADFGETLARADGQPPRKGLEQTDPPARPQESGQPKTLE